jgi:hypothetical protein
VEDANSDGVVDHAVWSGTETCDIANPGADPDGDGLTNAQEGALGTNPCVNDTDSDGCADSGEPAGAQPPEPGSTGAYNPLAWYDFYDVPVPANRDPTANGVKNKAVSLGDVGAVLFYTGASRTGICGDNPNGVGVDYDCDKNGDTIADGLNYDRSPSAAPNPPWDAGPPNSAISLADVGAVLAQVGLDCSGPP